MRKNIKDILIDTVLQKVVRDFIYYERDYEVTLKFSFTEDVIDLFNKHISYKEIQQAIKNGIRFKDEHGYY